MRRSAIALLIAAMLAGCAGGARLPADAPLAAAAAPVPGPTGIEIPNTGREIGFGRALEGAEPALARLYGPPARRRCAEGPGTVLTLAGGLELHFPGGTFTGWRGPQDARGRLC